MATPIEGYPNWGTEQVTEVIEGKTFISKVAPPSEVQTSGLKYQEPPARGWMNYQFNLIRKWIQELDSRTSGGSTSLGWISYTDDQYTEASPFVVPVGTTALLPNNAATVINSSAPTGAGFYDGTKITPDNIGDAYTLSLRFKAEASTNEGALEISLDIGDGTEIIILGDSRRLVRGSNDPQPITFDLTFFTLATFVANGGVIKLRADTGNISVFDISYMLQRTYRKDNS